MNDEALVKQLELYSNAIVAFIAVQALTFCFYFGTNPFFNALVKKSLSLSITITIMFFVSLILSSLGIQFMGKNIITKTCRENKTILGKVFIGKIIVVIFCNIFPIFFTVKYAVLPRL
ncbi:MAG: hypothetical protein GKS00_16795 [Alphaproteobacteria bacterium]|nr:hypothetical protein [Alphaproteobacteria bacterium]